jgi:class 3 adenylate cyclase
MSSDLNPLQTRLADGSGGQFDLTEDTVDQMLALAERLRMSNGGVLDDDAIQAVAEATGAPTEYVRLAVKVRAEKENRSRLTNLRAQFLTLDPETRRMVGVGTMATVCAFLFALEYRLGTSVSQYGVLSMVGLIALSLGLYQVALSKDVKWAGVNGAILGGAFFGMYAVFSLLMQSAMRIYAPAILPIMIGGGIAGALLKKAVEKNRDSLGLRDPIKERQELLSQLVELQDRLRSGEQSVTFLSVDIVGSTKMKLKADLLAVEYTFTEYHGYVERITVRYGGRVHSTAGDGVTCAFDHPHQAFAAAKTIQSGLFELNTFRNRLGSPITLRCGVHTGTVVTPQGGDIKSLNFSHVIDVAATIQKYCPPGGVAVTEASVMYLPGGATAVGEEMIEAADTRAAIWRPKAMVTTGSAEQTPPLPAV